jgi:O-acetyl-ADP-ribose deacetylase
MSVLLHATVGNIVHQTVDAIVNAANSSLLGGGGVDGAIHYAAGPQLKDYCRTLGGCPPGEARITPGFSLPASWVIHTVGPIWDGGSQGEDEILTQCYRASLTLAGEYSIKRMAFPAISTGAFGFPIDRATRIAVTTVRDYLRENEQSLFTEIIFVCYDAPTHHIYDKILRS